MTIQSSVRNAVLSIAVITTLAACGGNGFRTIADNDDVTAEAQAPRISMAKPENGQCTPEYSAAAYKVDQHIENVKLQWESEDTVSFSVILENAKESAALCNALVQQTDGERCDVVTDDNKTTTVSISSLKEKCKQADAQVVVLEKLVNPAPAPAAPETPVAPVAPQAPEAPVAPVAPQAPEAK